MNRRIRVLQTHALPLGYVAEGGTAVPSGDEGIRTPDPLLARQVLSHLSYTPGNTVGLSGLEPPTSRLSGARSNRLSYRPTYHGDGGIRTLDPLLARQVLSQLSYTPILKMLAATCFPTPSPVQYHRPSRS